ncbi:ABC transporter ATP-binding protein [Corticibacterium sp. UT-5YL-CI-8]|nr:ABC transporter ATP-binding protein [Tianweitania sp. UT-5YL-CI-8]
MSIIKLTNLEKSYGALKVLRGIDAEIGEGETFAIIGPNGAGKTTLFKVMTGEVPSNGGRVEFDGKDVTHDPAYRRARAGMGRTFQVARVFLELTVIENVIIAIEARRKNTGDSDDAWYAVVSSRSVVDEARQLLANLDLELKRNTEASILSHGDKKRLELAITLAGRPRILMLDEPTAGMSPSDRIGVVDLIRRLRDESRLTIVMTEHDMSVIFGLADRIMVMNQGARLAIGSIDEIRSSQVVRDVYLGKESQHD